MILRRLLLLTATAAGICTARADNALSLLKKLDDGFTTVFQKVAPTVVVIEATHEETDEPDAANRPFDFFFHEEDSPGERKSGKAWGLPEAPTQSEGSGFFIRPDGYIVTNRHVIAGADKIEVRGFDERRWVARVIATDERTDIAVLKVDAQNVPVITWGDSDALRVGQLVCAIGAPFNQDYSFTCGWVSGKGRSNLLAPSSPKTIYEDYIQTDAFINPGNSGGPLFDVEGRIIGMNTLINGLGRGLAFAIPSNLLRDVSDQLIANGRVRRPWLGVRVTSLDNSKTLREQFPGVEHGVVINTIEAGAPAADSDLQPGDLVTAIDGHSLRSAHELVRTVQRKKVGETVSLSVQRRDAKLLISIATREQPDEPGRTSVPRPGSTIPVIPSDPGLKLTDAKPDAAMVLEATPGGPAAKADLRKGDIITGVGGEALNDPSAILKAIRAGLAEEGGKGALIQFLRNGKKSWVVIERVGQ